MHRDHRFAQGRMSDALDGDLTPRQRARFARHVDDCPECGPMLRGLIRVRGVLRTLAAGETGRDASVVPAVLERMRQEAGEPEPGGGPRLAE